MEKSAKSLSVGAVIVFTGAVIAWVICFWGLLTSRLSLTSDALSYYDHIKFYVESLSRGVFPLWDPFVNYWGGAGNEFFLRRLGPYNPLYVLMALLVKGGVPFREVYLWGMSAYFMLGMALFYLLAYRIYQHRVAAMTGTLILMFSSLGTRIFDSYMMLVTVPLIAFFYFLVAFIQSGQRWSFLGIVLATGILLTTYIPLYFLVFFTVFVLVFIVVYRANLGDIARKLWSFIKQHRWLVLGAVILLGLSLIPTVMFMKTAAKAQIVIPGRHDGSASTDQLQVAYDLAASWGIPEDLMFSSYFADLKRFRFAVLYFPIFAFIVLGLALRNALTRMNIFILACAFMLLSLTVPHFLPIHGILYERIALFKYFRNLHFFLWFMLIPLFALFVVDQLKGIFEKASTGKLSLGWVSLVHGLAIIGLVCIKDTNWTNYGVVLISYLVFLCILNKKLSLTLLMPCLALVVILQPLEAYRYFSGNIMPYVQPYIYDNFNHQFKFEEAITVNEEQKQKRSRRSTYMAPYWYDFYNNKVNDYVFNVMARYRLLVYDTEQTPETIEQLERFEEKPTPVLANSAQLSVSAYNANQLSLVTNFDKPKFIVYNDSYDPQWQVKVNGRASTLYRANIAFKGVWVPAGKARVDFTYDKPWRPLYNWALVMAYAGIAIYLLMLRRKHV